MTRDALAAIHYAPAYVCTSLWTVLAWNRAMSLVWGLEAPGGRPFNIVVRMFADEAMRAMHGARFRDFAGDLVAMVRASAAAHLERDAYREMVDALRADALFASLWDAYEVVRPIRTTSTEVVSATVGIFTCRTLTLEVPDDREHWIVLQIPDAPSLRRLRAKLDESDGGNN